VLDDSPPPNTHQLCMSLAHVHHGACKVAIGAAAQGQDAPDASTAPGDAAAGSEAGPLHAEPAAGTSGALPDRPAGPPGGGAGSDAGGGPCRRAHALPHVFRACLKWSWACSRQKVLIHDGLAGDRCP